MSKEAEPVEYGHFLTDADIARHSPLALADRLTRGEILTYDPDGWVVREFPGQRIVRICRSEDFRAEEFP